MKFSEICPRLIKRDRDLGWLAVSPDGAHVAIGVEATTEARAIERWRAAAQEWEALLPEMPPHGVNGQCLGCYHNRNHPSKRGSRRRPGPKKRRSVEHLRRKYLSAALRPPPSQETPQ
jgi:hypothetical protein